MIIIMEPEAIPVSDLIFIKSIARWIDLGLSILTFLEY